MCQFVAKHLLVSDIYQNVDRSVPIGCGLNTGGSDQRFQAEPRH